MLRLPIGSWSGEESSLDQSMGGYGRGNPWKGRAAPFAVRIFAALRLASGSVSVAQLFLVLPSGFFACTVLTKEGLLAQATEECRYGALGRSWFTWGKLGAGAMRAEPPCKHQRGSTTVPWKAWAGTSSFTCPQHEVSLREHYQFSAWFLFSFSF